MEYFLFNPLTRMYYCGWGCGTAEWTNSQCEIKRFSLEDVRRLRKMHFDKWGEDTWIVLFETIA